MLQCYLNSYLNNRNLKFALKNCAFQRVGTFHRETGCTECQFLLLCRKSDSNFQELYHGHKTSRECFTFSLQLPPSCPGLLIQNGEKLHSMLMEELDLYSAELWGRKGVWFFWMQVPSQTQNPLRSILTVKSPKLPPLQGLPLALCGYLVNSHQNKLQSKTKIIYSTGWASSFNCFCTSGDKQC